jgi:hypothetical protein
MGVASSPQPIVATVNRGYRALFALIAACGIAGLSACTPEAAKVSPEQLLAMIPTGEPLLTCRADCLAAWRAAEPQAETLAAGRRWSDLALLVLKVNYEDDLTDYYLAQAAQGMGYRTAAASYYRQSIELSGGPAACAAYSRLCGGVALPRAAEARLAALGRPVPHRHPPAEKNVEEPPPAPAAPVETAPLAAPVRAPSQEEEQFIEPPPARP